MIGHFVELCVDKHNGILETTYNADVAATAVSVVSSNPPSRVDTQPDSKESGIFLPDVLILTALEPIPASRPAFHRETPPPAPGPESAGGGFA